jgi:hypothetical protein
MIRQEVATDRVQVPYWRGAVLGRRPELQHSGVILFFFHIFATFTVTSVVCACYHHFLLVYLFTCNDDGVWWNLVLHNHVTSLDTFHFQLKLDSSNTPYMEIRMFLWNWVNMWRMSGSKVVDKEKETHFMPNALFRGVDCFFDIL